LVCFVVVFFFFFFFFFVVGGGGGGVEGAIYQLYETDVSKGNISTSETLASPSRIRTSNCSFPTSNRFMDLQSIECIG
jgi:hypothetical protein